jgi:hypothetical protein
MSHRRNSKAQSISKFENRVTELVWSLSLDGGADEEVGSSSEAPGTWAGLMRDGRQMAQAIEANPVEFNLQPHDADDLAEIEECAGVILFEDTQGFVTSEVHNDGDALEERWDEVDEDLGDDEEEDEYDDDDDEDTDVPDEEYLGNGRFELSGPGPDDIYQYGPASIEVSGGGRSGYWATVRCRKPNLGEKDFEGRTSDDALDAAMEWIDAAPELARYHENRGEPADPVAARELELHIVNTGRLFDERSQAESIRQTLLRKMKRGTFDEERSVKAWEYLVEAGAKDYAKEHAEQRDWHRIFSVATRHAVAESLAKSFATEARLGNWELTRNADTPERHRRRSQRMVERMPAPIRGVFDPGHGFADIRAGMRVTFRTAQGQERSGRAIMLGPHGWVLDVSGAHTGRRNPVVVDERSFIGVSGRGSGTGQRLGGIRR